MRKPKVNDSNVIMIIHTGDVLSFYSLHQVIVCVNVFTTLTKDYALSACPLVYKQKRATEMNAIMSSSTSATGEGTCSVCYLDVWEL